MRLRRVTALNRSAIFYFRAPVCQFINCNVGVLEGSSGRPLLNLTLNSQLCTSLTFRSSVLLFVLPTLKEFVVVVFFILPFVLENFVDFSKSQFEFQPKKSAAQICITGLFVSSVSPPLPPSPFLFFSCMRTHSSHLEDSLIFQAVVEQKNKTKPRNKKAGKVVPSGGYGQNLRCCLLR